MTDLSQLIERIEAAEGPDREIDALIHFGINRKWAGRIPSWPPEKIYRPGMEPGLYMIVEGNGYMYGDSVPAYTASLDAAITLKPSGDGHWPQLIMTGTNPNNPRRQRDRAGIWVNGGTKPFRGHAATPALALCAAAIRTLQSGKDEG